MRTLKSHLKNNSSEKSFKSRSFSFPCPGNKTFEEPSELLLRGAPVEWQGHGGEGTGDWPDGCLGELLGLAGRVGAVGGAKKSGWLGEEKADRRISARLGSLAEDAR